MVPLTPWFLDFWSPELWMNKFLLFSVQFVVIWYGSPRRLIQQYISFIYLFFNLSIYFWLCWVFISVQRLSLVAASGGHSSSRCAGLSLSRPLLLRSTSSRHAGSVVMAHGPSCSAACGIFPDQGSNPCPLHWQADSQPLHHQGSPIYFLLNLCILYRSHWYSWNFHEV